MNKMDTTNVKEITNVMDSETYMLFRNLKGYGYNANLHSEYANDYMEGRNYLSIHVYETDANRIANLHGLCPTFEVVLMKMANSRRRPMFEVRKHRKFAECVSDGAWMEYYSNTVEV